jgi:hypothetical protein
MRRHECRLDYPWYFDPNTVPRTTLQCFDPAIREQCSYIQIKEGGVNRIMPLGVELGNIAHRVCVAIRTERRALYISLMMIRAKAD